MQSHLVVEAAQHATTVRQVHVRTEALEDASKLNCDVARTNDCDLAAQQADTRRAKSQQIELLRA